MSDAEQRATAAAREIAQALQVSHGPNPIDITNYTAEELIAAIILKHQPAWVSVQERLPEQEGEKR